MTTYTVNLTDSIGINDQVKGVQRKVLDESFEDIVIARFWVQPFRILETTTFSQPEKEKIQKILNQLAEDMLSLRNDIMNYSKEVTRYFEGVKRGEFYEVRGNIEYYKEVFHGKKFVENFYFHAEICKRDAYRLLKVIEPNCPSWNSMYGFLSNDHFNYARIASSLQLNYTNLMAIHEIRGGIEHSYEENDFDITDIYLEETNKGIAFHQPYFKYPEIISIKQQDGSTLDITLKGVTVIDLLDKHFWSIFNVCENISTLCLIKYLDHSWQPRLLAMSSYDPKCPVQWIVEKSEKPRRTVNSLPT